MGLMSCFGKRSKPNKRMGLHYSKHRHKPRIRKDQIPWLLRGAIRSNNVETLTYLLSYPNDVDPSMVIDGVCPLNLAVELGYVPMVKLLIKAGANIHVPDAPMYPLLQASLYGRAEILQLLLAAGADPSVRNEHLESAFHLLCEQSSQRYTDTAAVLLASGCNPNCLDANGLAALHRATPDIARALLGHFSPSAINKSMAALAAARVTASLAAAIPAASPSPFIALRQEDMEPSDSVICAADNEKTVVEEAEDINNEVIDDAGASTSDVPQRNVFISGVRASSAHGRHYHSSCPLHPGSVSGRRSSAPAAAAVAVAASLESKGSKSGSSWRTTTTLSNAGLRNNKTASSNSARPSYKTITMDDVIAAATVAACATDPNIISLAGDTPLTSAIKDRRETMVSVLATTKNIELDRADKIGMTPLMIAAESGVSGLPMAAMLLTWGCCPARIDKQGMTALHHACYVGCLPMTRYLLDQPECAKHHLFNKVDKYGRSPLYLATSRGHVDVVNFLLARGALCGKAGECQPDIHLPNKEKKSPLYISAYFGHLDIVQALLRNGAQVDQADSHNKTPLYVATYHGRTDIVDLLLRHNSNVNAADKNGKTPLYIAVLHGHFHIAEKLLHYRAAVNQPDKDGLAPLHMAVKFPKLDIPMVKLLLSHGCDPLNLHGFTKWLLENQIIPDESINGDPEFCDWLKREENTVRSLKQLCRIEIQRILGHTDSMKSKVLTLPLPPQIQNYVSLRAL